MFTNFDKKMLNKALKLSNSSLANKRKVGAYIVDNITHEVLGSGYNRMFNNLMNCENNKGESYESVIHAEEAAIINMFQTKFDFKIPKTIYVTYSPCMNCCKLMVHAGITRLVYINEHKVNFDLTEIENGISPREFLLVNNVSVERCLDYQQPNKIALIYHCADNDGKMSGTLFSIMFEKEIKDGIAELIPYNYQKVVPWKSDKYTEFIFGDIVPPLEWLDETMHEKIMSNKVIITIFDHHKDVYKQINGLMCGLLINYYFSDEKSACQIIFENRVSNVILQELPIFKEIIESISAYDTWKFTNPSMSKYKNDILGFNLYLQQFYELKDFSKQITENLNYDAYHKLIELGQSIINKITSDNDDAIKKGLYIEKYDAFIFEGYPNYWVFDQIEKYLKTPIEYWIGYTVNLKENFIKFSIRSKFKDCNEIAKKFEGNGHSKAAGFSVPIELGFAIIKSNAMFK